MLHLFRHFKTMCRCSQKTLKTCTNNYSSADRPCLKDMSLYFRLTIRSYFLTLESDSIEEPVILCVSSRCLTFNDLLALLLTRHEDKSSKRRRT